MSTNHALDKAIDQARGDSPPPLPGDFADQVMGRLPLADGEVWPPFAVSVLGVAAGVALIVSGVVAASFARSDHFPQLALFQVEAATFNAHR